MTNQNLFTNSWRTFNDPAATFAARIEAHAALTSVLKKTRKSPKYYGVTHGDITNAVQLLNNQMDEFAKATRLPLPYDPHHSNVVRYRFTDITAMSPLVDDISAPSPTTAETVAAVTPAVTLDARADNAPPATFPWWVVYLATALLALGAVLALTMD